MARGKCICASMRWNDARAMKNVNIMEPSPSSLSRPPMMHSLDEIVEQLDRHHQRATYGAVAALVGQAPRSLMKGRQRAPRYCWVVSSTSSLPTGYADEEKHPALEERTEVLTTREALLNWLGDPR
jgi:hypothetical protein